MNNQKIHPEAAPGQGESPAPAPEGYRPMILKEVVQAGDVVWPVLPHGVKAEVPITAIGLEIEPQDVGYFFRPIPPAPQSGIETAILPRAEAPAICSHHGEFKADEGCAPCISETETHGALGDIGIRAKSPEVQEGSTKGGAPDRLFLQVEIDDGFGGLEDANGEETHCRDRINDTDVEYIRLDLHMAELAALRASNESLATALRKVDGWFRSNNPSIPGGFDNETWIAVRAALSPVSTGGASHG